MTEYGFSGGLKLFKTYIFHPVHESQAAISLHKLSDMYQVEATNEP